MQSVCPPASVCVHVSGGSSGWFSNGADESCETDQTGTGSWQISVSFLFLSPGCRETVALKNIPLNWLLKTLTPCWKDLRTSWWVDPNANVLNWPMKEILNTAWPHMKCCFFPNSWLGKSIFTPAASVMPLKCSPFISWIEVDFSTVNKSINLSRLLCRTEGKQAKTRRESSQCLLTGESCRRWTSQEGLDAAVQNKPHFCFWQSARSKRFHELVFSCVSFTSSCFGCCEGFWSKHSASDIYTNNFPWP